MEASTNKNRFVRKDDLRKKILDIAKELFLKHGYTSISIRKIANKLAISPTTIYLYYKDKSSLIYALHQEGFIKLRAQFEVLAHVEEPFERLKAMGRSYINFAIENPDYYELMFIMKGPLEFVKLNCSDEWKEGSNTFKALLSAVEECKSNGYFKSIEAYIMALHIWATMHGICCLKLQGHLDNVLNTHLEEKKKSFDLDETFEALALIIKDFKE